MKTAKIIFQSVCTLITAIGFASIFGADNNTEAALSVLTMCAGAAAFLLLCEK